MLLFKIAYNSRYKTTYVVFSLYEDLQHMLYYRFNNTEIILVSQMIIDDILSTFK